MPYCIKAHPFGTVPIRQALDGLEVDDYDKLIMALGQLINPPESDVEKKSDKPSAAKESPTDG